MLNILLTFLITASLATASFLLTYFIFGLLNRSPDGSEPPINDVIMTQITNLFQTIVNAAGDMFSTISGKFFGFVANIQTNLRIYLQILMLVLFIVSYTFEKEMFLTNIDRFWRCGIHPLFSSVLFSILQAGRLLFGGLTPIFNYGTLVTKQLVVGTRLSVFLCSTNSLFESLVIFLNMVLTIFQSVTMWTGFGEGLSMENNIIFNELQITKVVLHAQRLVLKQSAVAGCACGGLVDVFEFIFIACRQDELAFAVNHLVNIPVSLFQTLFQVMPPWQKLPMGTKVVNHVNGFIYYMSKYADQVVMKWLIHTISLFDDSFQLQGLPEEFVFVALGRLGMGLVHVGWTGYRTVATVAIPFTETATATVSVEDALDSVVNQATKGDYMLQVSSMAQAIEQVQLGYIGLSNIIAWMFQIIHESTRSIAKAIMNGEPIELVLPAHKLVVCNKELDSYYDFVACGIREFLILPANTNYLIYTFAMELLFKSILNEEENALKTMQRFDGISYPRTAELTCEYRKSINYDMTAKECRCDLGINEFRRIRPEPGFPFGRAHYDPFCGQPNLQVNYFGGIKRMTDYFAGRSFEKVRQIMKAYRMFIFEAQRSAIKAALNIMKIIDGDYFQYKTNCGYGVSRPRLETWFNQTDNTTTYEEKITTQRDYYINEVCRGCSEECENIDELPYFHEVEKIWKCKLIHESLEDMMCISTANPDGKEVTDPTNGKEYTISVQTCATVNEAGCECNMLLPLDDLNECSCIRTFPDSLMEYSQTAYNNPILAKIHTPEVSIHWCNTYWLEWILYSVSDFADVVERVAGVFHPAYSSDADTGNEFCEQASFDIFDSKVLRFPRYKFDMQEGQFNKLGLTYTEESCSLYGTKDFICSTTMTVRNVVALVVNEVRMIVMTLNKFLDFDFKGIKLSLGERVCDAARALSALASLLPSLLDDSMVGEGVQRGLSRVLFSLFNTIVSALDMINVLLSFIDELATARISFTDGAGLPIFNLMFTLLHIIIDWWKLVLNSFGYMLNELKTNAGSALLSMEAVIAILADNLLNEAALELIGLILKVTMQIVQFFTAGKISGSFGDFIKDIFTILLKAVKLLLNAAGKLLSLILDMMGPAGQAIRSLANDVCTSIQDFLRGLTFNNDLSIGCVPFRRRRRRMFEVNNQTMQFQNIIHHFAQEVAWNGTSNCDMFIHAYKDYKWDDLRPIEHIQLFDCVQLRHAMVEVNKVMGTSIPEDLLYNWERKWQLASTFVSTGVIYLEHKLGKITAKEMLHKLRHKQIDFNEWLPTINNINKHVGNTFTMASLHSGIEYLFKEFDPNIDTTPSVMGHTYRLYSIGQKARKELKAKTKHIKWDLEIKQLLAGIDYVSKKFKITMPKVPPHLYHGWDTYTKLRQKPKTKSKLYARNMVLRATGLQTDITPCSDNPDSLVCLNCVVVDNLLNVIIKEGNEMAAYYENVYTGITIPSFVKFWTNSSASAWREDAGAAVASAIDIDVDINLAYKGPTIPTYMNLDTYEFDLNINPATTEGVDTSYDPNKDPALVLQRSRLKHFHDIQLNKTLTYDQRAAKDWEWFINKEGWNPLKTHSGEEARPSLIFVLVQFFMNDYDEYVPFFARSFRYYIYQPIRDCSMDNIYCRWNTFQQRQQLISDAFQYMLVTTLVLYGSEFVTGLPIFSSIMPYILFIWAFIYMYTVYGYTYGCIPQLPNCIVEDFYAYLHDNVYPECFCVYLPSLANNCDPDTCYLCTRSTEFADCRKEISTIDELGLVWAPVFWLRVYFPNVLIFLYKTVPFSWGLRNYESIKNITRGAVEAAEITQLEMDCLNVSYVDIVLLGVIIWLIAQVFVIVAPLTVRALQHTINVAIIYITMIYSMIISLELQTVKVKAAE